MIIIEPLYQALRLALPSPPGPPMLLGARFNTQRDAAPRIVLVPDTETLEGPDPALRAPSFATPLPGSYGPPVATRATAIEVTIWGPTSQVAEEGFARFVAALRRLVGMPALGFAGGAWSRPDFETVGEALRFTFTIRTPLWAVPPWASVDVEGIESECGGFLPLPPVPMPTLLHRIGEG